MERHLTAYDIFALLVPGALALGLGWMLLDTTWPMPAIPETAQIWVWVGTAAVAVYVFGHVLERINASRLVSWRGFGLAFLGGLGWPRRSVASYRLLARGSDLGAALVDAVFHDLNRRFGTDLTPTMRADRGRAFMLCSAYLQQNGSAARASVMQTLYRLCTSLRDIFMATALVSLLGGLAHLVGALLHWQALSLDRPWSVGAGGWLLGMAALGLLLSARFDEKAATYDEHFVSSTIRGYAAAVVMVHAADKPGNIGPNKKRQ